MRLLAPSTLVVAWISGILLGLAMSGSYVKPVDLEITRKANASVEVLVKEAGANGVTYLRNDELVKCPHCGGTF